MSRKRQRKKQHKREQQERRRSAADDAAAPVLPARDRAPAADAVDGPAGSLPSGEVGRIRQLLDTGRDRAALERAKKLHRRTGTPESETLLGEAYAARIQALFASGMPMEARALSELVARRHPTAGERLERLRAVFAARQGELDELVRPLNDPALPARQRAEIEDALRQELRDPAALARCTALPDGHPLRKGAAAVAGALAAVTSGPVTDGDLALNGISRRSPLASWKPLVRAIAALHRGDDGGCERQLRAVAPGSAPSRLVPAMRAMMAGTPAGAPGSAAAALAARVGGAPADLEQALERLDRALEGGSPRRVYGAVRSAVERCEEHRPELLDRLRQHISSRALLADLPADEVREAMGGPSRKDACFWRLLARVHEVDGSPLHAAGLWEEFLCHAVHQGWFAEQGPEAAAVLLHMAGLCGEVPPEALEWERRRLPALGAQIDQYYEGQPDEIRAAVKGRLGSGRSYGFVNAERLYERAAACDPDPATFRAWHDRAHERADHKAADRAAEAWHRALPGDGRPLLLLMASAERRGALKKALKYLERAEACDGMNPEVRAARWRLLVSTARRHLGQGKVHLARKDLAALGSLPGAGEGDRPAFLDALRWLCAGLEGRGDEAAGCGERIAARLGGGLVARVLLSGLARACGLEEQELAPLPPEPVLLAVGDLAPAVARALRLGHEMGLPLPVEDRWVSRLSDELRGGAAGLPPGPLRALAEAALRSGRYKLAYAASGAGLRQHGAHAARFLLLRAQSLPAGAIARRRRCLDAAAWSARRDRRLDLLDEIADARAGRRTHRGRRRNFDPLDALPGRDGTMDRERSDEVIRREIEQHSYPVRLTAEDRDGLCDCPFCRLERGERVTPEELAELEDLEAAGSPGLLPDELLEPGAIPASLLDAMGEGLDEEMPPEVKAIALEMLLRYGGADGSLPDIEAIMRRDPELAARMDEIVEEYAGGRPQRRRSRRSRRSKRRRKRKR